MVLLDRRSAGIGGWVLSNRSSVCGGIAVEVVVLDSPDGDVIARGSYYGGPDYEFVVAADGHIDWRVVGEIAVVWAGPDVHSFRRIAAAWNRYRVQYRPGMSEEAKREFFSHMRREFETLGALPADLPPDPEPLWSLLLFEAENGLG